MQKLSEAQETILLAHASVCHPTKEYKGKEREDLNFVINSGFIDRKSGHINDRGAAYACSQLGYSFSSCIRSHAHWLERKFTTIAGQSTFRDMLNYVLNYFPSPQGLDQFFKARYGVLLKYELFNEYGAERQPEDNAAFMAETALDMLTNPSVDWRLVRNMIKAQAIGDQLGGIDTKEDLAALLRSYLNLKTETGYNAQTDQK